MSLLSTDVSTVQYLRTMYSMSLLEMYCTWESIYMDHRPQTTDGRTHFKSFLIPDINDFCRDRLYPKEKFLRKNWQEYLPNDRRSLYSVCMKHLLIPKGLNPREIWGRVIISLSNFLTVPSEIVSQLKVSTLTLFN